MPYVSDAQRRWAHTPTGEKALGGASKVAEWDAATKGRKLPERVKAPISKPRKTPITKGAGSYMPKKPKYGAGHYMSTPTPVGSFGSIGGSGGDDAGGTGGGGGGG